MKIELLLLSAVAILSPMANAASLLDFSGQGLGSFVIQPNSYGDNLAGTPNIGLSYTNASYNNALGPFSDALTTTLSFGTTAEIIFTPEAGYGVRLLSFQLGIQNFNNTQVLRLLDGAGNVLLDYASTSIVLSLNPTTYSPNLSQDGTLRLQFGTTWYSAIDNVEYEEYSLAPPTGGIPEPSSILLSLSGFGAILFASRNRFKRR